jgi:predicted phage-related endonuclease
MDNNNDQLLVLLRDRIKKIINMYEVEKVKNDELEFQKKELEQKISNLHKEKEELIVKYNNLRLAKQLDASLVNTHDAKLKVNRIVREIDKCIALLNK